MPKHPSKNGSAKQAGDYIQVLNTAGYVNNREITNLPGQYLVKGSQNTLIRNNEKVMTRAGYTRLGAAKTGNAGIHSSYDWNHISSGSTRSSRVFGTSWEVFYNGSWISLYTLPTSTHMEFTTWWNSTEQIDVMLGVNGTGKVYEWSGGITTINKVTASTITKQGYLASSTATIAFQNNGTGIAGNITKSDGGFINAGFKTGDTIVISGSTSNDQTVIVQSVSDMTIVVRPEYTVTAEIPANGTNIIIMWPNGTWAGQRFLTVNAGDSTNRKVKIGTTEYAYTGGESTGTLTGVTPDPSTATIAVGATAVQVVRVFTVATGSGQNPATSYAINLISTVGNSVFYGSLTNRTVYQTKNTDFKSCTWTNPLRIPGEGMTISLDSCPTAFIPGQKDANMYITAGTDDAYNITYKQSTQSNADGTSFITETVLTQKFNTSTGAAARSQAAVVFIRNAVAYLSFEPTIDTLQHQFNVVTNLPQAKPISDPIRDDIEAYNLTGAHGVYFRRNLYYTLPYEARVICFDMLDDNHYWQPPWTIALSRLAVITINGVQRLCGHSTSSNETYILNTGTNDNGSKFKAVAAFGYENYGVRFEYKNFDEAACELYISASTKVTDTINYDYKGGTDVRSFIIDGNDQDILAGPIQTGGEGSAPEGTNPEGSLADEIDMLHKARIIHQTGSIDFFERQRIFSSDSLDAQFAIIAYGENTTMSGNQPISIRK